uniref:Uncharacterized protein n=1 Tax=Callorhinchus milii TaxID=7868 RepID=A0A4W3HMT2_CALMI|eukprot:gi/632952422/ref/XP_007891843.1/ PREDICTED: UPF0488 protein C8orf33 homolog [Callorhinchus milii]
MAAVMPEEPPEETFQKDLKWCIQQLEPGQTQLDVSSKQAIPPQTEHCAGSTTDRVEPRVQESGHSFQVNFTGLPNLSEEAAGVTLNSERKRPVRGGVAIKESLSGSEGNDFPAVPSGTDVQETFTFTIPEAAGDPQQIALPDVCCTTLCSSGAVGNQDTDEKLAAVVGHENPAFQTSEALKLVDNVTSKTKKKKKKNSHNKPAAENTPKDAHQEGESQDSGGAPSKEPSLSPEEQLQREVDWCIEQLELGLRTQKSNQKQAEEALRAVRTLRSKKAPLVKKRQLMRLMFGDYRKKMEVDWQRQLKLMETAAKCASIKTDGVTPKGKVFRKCATQSSKHSQESCTTDSQTGIRKESGFFQTGQGEFCFNFF